MESIPDQTLTEDGSATTVNLSGHFEPHEPFFQDGRFTDSTGRTIHYRLQLRSDWDRTEPRGLVINFHGNNRGSPQQMLEWFGHNEAALDMGLIHAAVAAPRSYTEWELSLEDDGTRSWSPQDARLIHELLRSHFDGNATIDHDRIVFQGGSQGPCFINHFLATYGHAYGGGFYSLCGCLWPHGLINPWHPTIQWTPHMASSVSQRFRVFVQITTEDFLFAESVAMRDLYHDVLGFETRWDFDAPGGHCSPGVTPYGEILEWLSAPLAVPPTLVGATGDHDGDGIEDHFDSDDDNDGAPDAIDALPWEPMEWLDSDSDGIGNFLDHDADGDGVANSLDAFPLDPLESGDHDGDGIGDRLDLDDDNDDIPDTTDPEPLRGPRNDQLSFTLTDDDGFEPGNGWYGVPRLASVHASRPANVTYPEFQGTRQIFAFITLGDSANPVFEIMVDSLKNSDRCEDVLVPELCGSWTWRKGEGIPSELKPVFFPDWTHLIYFDQNQNRDLTDDGPPLVIMDTEDVDLVVNASGVLDPGTQLVLHVPYRTGERLPYGITMTILHGSKVADPRLAYNVNSYWVGYVSVPGGAPVRVGTVDANLDGRFDTGTVRAEAVFTYHEISPTSYSMSVIGTPEDIRNLRDYACIDLDRDGELEECAYFGSPNLEEDDHSLTYAGDSFVLDGHSYSIEIAATGHRVRIR